MAYDSADLNEAGADLDSAAVLSRDVEDIDLPHGVAGKVGQNREDPVLRTPGPEPARPKLRRRGRADERGDILVHAMLTKHLSLENLASDILQELS